MQDLASHLAQLGIVNPGPIYANLLPSELYDKALQNKEAKLTSGGVLVACTGAHTGRSPHDKFIVSDDLTENKVAWGSINQRFSPEQFDALKKRIVDWLQDKELYTQDLFVGADKDYRLPIRYIGTHAWHSLFAYNMFLHPPIAGAGHTRAPEFTVLHVPTFHAEPSRDETRSDVFVVIDFSRKLILIGGTSYAGEVKKSIFSVMNFLLPPKGVLPMHASANMGESGDVAIFFGLSGTGKTTLSADATRILIGDDEHGWTPKGVFNFEGGCYAKAIRLNPTMEPQIYAAATKVGSVLENVVTDPVSRAPDFDDASLAENSRASYPISFISNAKPDGIGGLPSNIVMLTCDAYGVLPPLSKLSSAQAMYHFLSGYTARVAGTERGVNAPQATFSACFGAPFLPLAPEIYAELLGQKIKSQNVDCWLVNTGWTGGSAGVGERMKINLTRALLAAVLSGTLAKTHFTPDPLFGLMIPDECQNVPSEILHPRSAWSDKSAYDAAAKKVAGLFCENFKKFAPNVSLDVSAAGFKI